MTPSEILREARARLEADWGPKKTGGHPLNGDYEHADYMRALFFLRAAYGIGPDDSLFHREKGLSKLETLAAYDRAIEFALSQETASV